LSSSLLSENTEIKMYWTVTWHVAWLRLLHSACYIKVISLVAHALSNIPEERRSHWLSMFGNGVPGKIIQPKTVEVTMHNELYGLCASPYVTWVIESRWMRWAGHVARVKERRCTYRVLVGTP